MKLFIPDLMKDDVYQFSPECFCRLDVKGIIFDIDNTLAPYEKERPDEKLKDYLSELTGRGIKIALVSNNSPQRVERFNEELGFFAVPDAHKPSTKGLELCISNLGVDKAKTVLIGDQIFTDCMAAHSAGIRCFVVKPIAKRETLFFKFKRFFEKPFIRAYKRREKAGKIKK